MPTIFRLEALLAERGIAQRQLARLSGLSYVTINRICRNTTAQVSLATLDAIADALDVHPGELLAKTAAKKGRR